MTGKKVSWSCKRILNYTMSKNKNIFETSRMCLFVVSSSKFFHCITNVCVVLQTYFLPVIGLVDAEKLSPGDLVVSYLNIQIAFNKKILWLGFTYRLWLGFTFRLWLGFTFRLWLGFTYKLWLGFTYRLWLGFTFRLWLGFTYKLIGIHI